MYHLLVERKLRRVFRRLGEGDSAIGGLRSSRESMQLWWERMYRLFPGLSFAVRDVAVTGWPWNTRIWTQLDFVKPLPDGTLYTNVVMQRMQMRWGRIVTIHTLEDTQRCARFLAWQAQQGKAEALAPPITDGEWPRPGPFMRAQPVYAS